jgi:superfamily II RNA helicase
MGAMDEHLQLQPLGLLARGLNGQNELWMALALSVPGLEQLTGPQLASYLGAILSTEVARRSLSVWSEYEVSPEVVELIDRLEPLREALFESQTVAGCEKWNEFLLVDLRLAGLVQAWAAGGCRQKMRGGGGQRRGG